MYIKEFQSIMRIGKRGTVSKELATAIRRWISSVSWLENFRRLTIDYEYLAETAEAMVQPACVQIMLNRFFV